MRASPRMLCAGARLLSPLELGRSRGTSTARVLGVDEGSITVGVDVANGRVVGTTMASTRVARPAHLLVGRAPEEGVRLGPLLFPVCGTAHAVALSRAIDAARGATVSPQLDAAREVACLAEAAASHVWQLALTWPDACGACVDDAALRTARRLAERVTVALFGVPTIAPRLGRPAWGEVRAASRCLAALTRECAGRSSSLPGAVIAAGREGFGRAFVETSAVPSPALIGRRLGADAAFAERPEIDRLPVDMSALARRSTDGGVRSVEATHGRGLLARLAARRADAAADAHRLESVARELELVSDVAPRASAEGPGAGTGVGAASTARGPLVYWVRLRPGAIDDVRAVAPTDWTFHPRGVLPQALVGAEATPALRRDVGWLVLALDPCVPWGVEVRDA